jgi:hypothetical protein
MNDARELSPEEYNKALFVNMVMMFSTSVLQHLGRVQDPSTGEVHTDFEAAQATIDLLDMLEQKTKGNLDDEESKMLTETCSALKMQFVQAKNAQGSTPAPAEADTPAAPQEQDQAAPAEEPSIEASSEGSRRTRFHKSYGEE